MYIFIFINHSYKIVTITCLIIQWLIIFLPALLFFERLLKLYRIYYYLYFHIQVSTNLIVIFYSVAQTHLNYPVFFWNLFSIFLWHLSSCFIIINIFMFIFHLYLSPVRNFSFFLVILTSVLNPFPDPFVFIIIIII
jgi:hypothetical protein